MLALFPVFAYFRHKTYFSINIVPIKPNPRLKKVFIAAVEQDCLWTIGVIFGVGWCSTRTSAGPSMTTSARPSTRRSAQPRQAINCITREANHIVQLTLEIVFYVKGRGKLYIRSFLIIRAKNSIIYIFQYETVNENVCETVYEDKCTTVQVMCTSLLTRIKCTTVQVMCTSLLIRIKLSEIVYEDKCTTVQVYQDKVYNSSGLLR